MGKRSLKQFLEILNCYHPTIKVSAEYSRATTNFLDVAVMRKGNQLVANLYVKPTDRHQYLNASSCHISHCKKSITFSQTLHLNRIFSENAIFEKRYNNSEVWLKEKVVLTSWREDKFLRLKNFRY